MQKYGKYLLINPGHWIKPIVGFPLRRMDSFLCSQPAVIRTLFHCLRLADEFAKFCLYFCGLYPPNLALTLLGYKLGETGA